MSDNSIVTMEKHSIAWSKAMSALIIVAGILAIVVPPAAGIAATILIGWLLVFAGAAHFAFGWHTRKMGGLMWGILLGLAYMIAGIYILFHPVAGLAALTLVLGAYLCGSDCGICAGVETAAAGGFRLAGFRCSCDADFSSRDLRSGRRAASGSSALLLESA